MIVLVDMDDVLADFEGEFISRWRKKYSDRVYFEKEQRTVFGILSHYPPEYEDDVRAVYTEKGFFSALPSITNGIKAVNAMLEAGNEVFLCTAPIRYFQNCVSEKYEWVEKNMGDLWTKRIILSRDKTLIRGNFLIDDNPEITGSVKPEWEHIIYDQAYNRKMNGRRITWDNWEEILPEIAKKKL